MRLLATLIAFLMATSSVVLLSNVTSFNDDEDLDGERCETFVCFVDSVDLIDLRDDDA